MLAQQSKTASRQLRPSPRRHRKFSRHANLPDQDLPDEFLDDEAILAARARGVRPLNGDRRFGRLSAATTHTIVTKTRK